MLRKFRETISAMPKSLKSGAGFLRKSNAGGRKFSRSNHLAFEPLEPRLVLDSTVVFNEIMYNPVNPTDGGPADDTLEWVELYNQMAVNMDLNSWSLRGGIDFDFPQGTIVPGHGFLVIAKDPAALTGVPGGVQVMGPFTGQLGNGGEELRLENIDGRRMNVVDYNDRGDWPMGADGSGASLAKYDPDTASGPAENWTFSAEIGGTPGAVNFTAASNGPNEVTETLLAAGAEAWAFVPTVNSNLALTWTETGFNDASWTHGTTGVGYDRATTYNYLFGLDLDAPPDGQAAIPMDGINETVYIRIPFEVQTDPDAYDSIRLRMQYEDGFVAYLNGVAVANSPGDLPAAMQWNSGSAQLHSDGAAQVFDDFDITAYRHLLVEGGENVLAIHGLNRGLGSSDLLIRPELVGVRTLPDPEAIGAVVLNEVAAAGDPDVIPPGGRGEFYVEIGNFGGLDVEIGGYVLAATGDGGGEYVFPAQTISDGELLVLDETQLGFRPVDGESLFLYSPGRVQLVDARRVTNRLRGLSEEHGGQWLYPSQPTPGAANTFSFRDEIVINEIMYHAFPTLETDTTEYAESDEEWIELYNRSATTVSLGRWEDVNGVSVWKGWKLDAGIRYEFEPDTELGPGEYLVVAKDAVALQAKYDAFQGYPDFQIVGDYSGRLNNHDERIVLIDDYKNPADEVHYYESGRWPKYADGGGSSLELRDPAADNSKAEAWVASNEREKSGWNTYTYTRSSSQDLIGESFHELIIGLLDSGEILLDDIRVIKNPTGSRTEMMQNGSFEGDAENTQPANWRILGNHSGVVVKDPENSNNKVLHLTASGAQAFVEDHIETTFVGNTSYSSAQFEISFRAKWLAGSSQVNTRLYFTRAGNTAELEVSPQYGTPGLQNSGYQANIGPTYSEFGHAPLLPSSSQSVTVSVEAEDPDGVASMTLRYRRDGSSSFTPVTMVLGSGVYTGTIPTHSSGNIVQFYVEGRDTQGVTSTFPADGPNSRALYEVRPESNRQIDTIRIVMMNSDYDTLFNNYTGRYMSNEFVGVTMIHTWANGQEAFYDASARQVGSRFTRPSGFKLELGPDQPFRGVHDSIRLDWTNSKEILMKHMITNAGGTVSHYDDIAYLASRRRSGTVLLQLGRYSDVFLDEHFENGGDGTLYELDDITYANNASPSPEGLKTGTGYVSSDIRDRGDNKEDYRGYFLIKNNRARDDYSLLVEMSYAFDRLYGTALDEALEKVTDVDMWMRHYATQSFLGNWDTYGYGRHKNLRLYIRPEDQKVIPLPWDQDLGNYGSTTLLYQNSNLSKVRNRPQNLRLFWGHMWDLMNRSFNAEYIQSWATHYGSLSGSNYGGEVTKIANRVVQARNQITNSMGTMASVPFRITSNNGGDFTTNQYNVTIAGEGWINVREIRLAGSDEPLEVTWTDSDSWRLTLPVEPGENQLTLEAFNYQGSRFDYQGNPMGSHTITVTSTAAPRPMLESLRISEINYNPADPTPDEQLLGFEDKGDFEFVELQNVGDQPLELNGVRFTDGIEYAISGNAYEGTPVLITEVNTGTRDWVEIQNVSGAEADTTGWFMVANNADIKLSTEDPQRPNVNAFHEDLWELGESYPSMSAGQVLSAADDGDWGVNVNIWWETTGPGWTMLVDAGGNVVDFVAWGYSADEIASLSIDVVHGNDTFQLTAEGVWSGGGESETRGSTSTSLQRKGTAEVPASTDHDNQSDWIFATGASRDATNPYLTVPFTGSPVALGPGELVVVAKNPAALRARYGQDFVVVGPYDRSLSDGGENITLVDTFGSVIVDFKYGDSGGWPGRADGKGASLELIDPAAAPRNAADRTLYLEDPANWRSSDEYGGSPGIAGTDPVADVVINEVLTHTDWPQSDAIELYNTTDQPIDIGRWFLSDSWGWESSLDNGDYMKFFIPDGTIIPAHGYVVFDEDDFNPTWNDPQPNPLPYDFALSGAHGDEVWLMQTDEYDKLIRFVDHVEFGAAANGESFGRYPNGAQKPGSSDVYPMNEVTLGEPLGNGDPRVGPVVISEIMYYPGFFHENFNTGDVSRFSEVLGTWGVEPFFDDGRYLATPASPGQDTIALINLDDPLPPDYVLETDARSAPAVGGHSSNAVLIFDYYSPTNFKFAGLFVDTGQWRIGHRNAGGWVSDAVKSDLTLGPNRDYALKLQVNGSMATLTATSLDDGTKTTLGHDFGQMLNDGSLAIGTAGGVSHFATVAVEPAAESDLEFIELFNPTGQDINLAEWTDNPHTQGQYFADWRLRKGVNMEFDANTVIASQGTLVVLSFDPNLPQNAARRTAFQEFYGIDASVPLTGGYSGSLSNGGERIQLQRPDSPPLNEPGFIPHFSEDEVNYDDTSPWPTGADGNGHSLNRLTTGSWGNSSSSWQAATPSPGTPSLSTSAAVVGRHIFYNHSEFDGDNASASQQDDGAIAADKEALLPNQAATFANYTSYALGINGIMIDMVGLEENVELGADDFTFRVGNSDDPNSWDVLQQVHLSSITVRQGAGDDDSDRVTIIFGDGRITNQWLQVTVNTTADTRLSTKDVFYFGNAIGESGNAAADAKVDAIDVLMARNNPRNLIVPAGRESRYDYNRDRRVNATDMLLARDNQTHLLNALRLIDLPAAKDSAGGAATTRGGASDSDGLLDELALEYAAEQAETRATSKSDRSAEEAVDQLLSAYFAS